MFEQYEIMKEVAERQANFLKDCKLAFAKHPELFNNDIFKSKRYLEGINGYEGLICWYSLVLNDDFRDNKLKSEYKDLIKCIHIRPFRLENEDVNNTNNIKSMDSYEFRDLAMEKGFDAINYDPRSGNYHKLPNEKYQVVLCKRRSPLGPGAIFSKAGLKKDISQLYIPNVTGLNTEEANYVSEYRLETGSEYVTLLVTEALKLIMKPDEFSELQSKIY